MPLSFYIVARNEAANLPRCLASIKPVADEIIVCDTGSTDATAAIARSYDARIIHHPWADSFADARNAALAAVTGDWAFSIDADEELLPQSHAPLRHAISRPDAFAYTILRQDLFRADDPGGYTEMLQLRLHRNLPGLRMVGRCHQHFHPPLEHHARQMGMRIYRSEIRLRHHGYLPERRAEKLARAARLLELELRDNPGDLYYQIELGRTLIAMGNDRGHQVLAAAIDQTLTAAAAPTPPSPLVSALLEYVFIAPHDRYLGRLTQPEALHLALRWFPTRVPLLVRCAQHAFETHNLPLATNLLAKAFTLGDSHTYDKTTSFNPALLSDKTRLNLGICHAHQRQTQQAKAIFQRLLTSPTVGPEARRQLALLDPTTPDPSS